MKVNIYDPSQDATQIKGFTIVVDVFRAFSTAYFIDRNKPDRYIVTDSIDHSFALRDAFPETVLIGERGGIKVEGFDFGNSPTEMCDRDFSGKTIVHNTTAGTKGVLAQPAENEVVVGSFVNSRALLDYIESRDYQAVNIYCTAPRGNTYGEEDYVFADYIKAKLLDEQTDFEGLVSYLRQGSGRGFKAGGFAPYTDFLYCLDVNRFDKILGRKLVDEPHHSVELIPIKI